MENTAERTLTANSNSQNRIFYLDVLRAIACLSVVMIHVSARFAIKDFNSVNFWIGNILDSASRIGVPLFVMISGALMLDESYEITKEKLLRHIRKMVIFFVSWSIFYCIAFKVIHPLLRTENSLDFKEIVSSLINGATHLWFVYMIIGLYLLVPLLRLWVKKINAKYVKYFLLLAFLFSFLFPQIVEITKQFSGPYDVLNTILKDMLLRYVSGFTTYFILGWYLNNFPVRQTRTCFFAGSAALLITIFGTYFLSARSGKSVTLYNSFTCNVLIYSVMVFILIKNRFGQTTREPTSFIKRTVSVLSENSLGIYAIHAAIASTLFFHFGSSNAVIIFPIFVASVSLSLLATVIIKKFKFLNVII